MKKKKLIASGLVAGVVVPYGNITTFAKVEQSNEDVEYVNLDENDLQEDYVQNTKVYVSMPYVYTMTIPKDENEFIDNVEDVKDAYYNEVPYTDNTDILEVNKVVEDMIGVIKTYETNLSEDDQDAFEELVNTYEDNGCLTEDEIKQLKEILDNVEKESVSQKAYDKVVADNVSSIQDTIQSTIADGNTSQDELNKTINEAFDIINNPNNISSLSSNDKKTLNELETSYKENGTLSDVELAKLNNLLNEVLKEHIDEDEYEQHLKDELEYIVDNDEELSNEVKNEIITSIIEDLKESDSLDYQDKNAIKTIENTLNKDNTPSKDEVNNLLTNLNTTISTTDKNYDTIVSIDTKVAENNLMDVLTKDTTDNLEVEKAIENALNIAEANKDNLSISEKKELEELQASYDKNGSLTESEIVDLMDVLDSILEDHVTKDSYDDYVSNKLDTIIDNYDKLDDETKKDLLEDVVEDLKNSDNLDYQDKDAIKELENALAKDETPSIDVVTNVKDNLDNVISKDDDNYDKVVSDDTKNASSNLMDVLTKDTTDSLEVEKAIENAINIANSNKDDLSKDEQAKLEEIESSYDKDGSLSNSEITDLKDILDSVLEDHVTKNEYDQYAKDQLDNIIDNYDKLDNDTKKDLLENVVEDLKNSDNLDYQDKDAIKELENTLTKDETPSIDVVTNVKDNLDNVVSKDDDNYDNVVSEDTKNASSNLMDVLTKDTTDSLEIEKAIENAINIANSNKDDLSKDEQNKLEEIESSYDKNGSLSNSEITDLKDILDSVLEDHVTKDEYDQYAKDQLDNIIDNYDKLDNDTKKDLLENVVEDLKNSDNLDYQDKDAIKDLENALNKDETPSIDVVTNVKDNLDNVISKNDDNYDKVVSEDTKNASSNLMDVLTKDTTDSLEVEKAIENAINIANSNKDDLSKDEQAKLEEIESSYDKDGSLSNSEITDLKDILDSVLEDHVTKDEYDQYAKDQLDNIIDNYDKLDNDTKKDLLENVVEDLKNSDSLDYQDKDAIKELENALDKNETPTIDTITNVKDNLDNVISKDDDNYDKVVSEDTKNASSNLMDVLTKDTTDSLEVEKAIENAINIANSNKDDLSKDEQAKLEEIESSYDKDGSLSNSEITDLKDILDSVLEDHVTKDEYDQYAKDQLDDIIDNYDKLDDDTKKDLLENVVEDLKNSDSLDYQDKDAIKELENALDKDETPSIDSITNVKDNLDKEVSKDDDDYNEVVSNDIQNASSNLMDVLTKDTTDNLEVEKSIENAINIADSNKDSLSDEQQKLLDEISSSYDENGTLTNKEIVDLMDVLDTILEDHSTKEEYDQYSKDKLDDIIDNYSKIPDDVKNDVISNTIEDLKNSNNLDYQDKDVIKEIENALEKGKTPSLDEMTSLKNNLNNNVSSSNSDYDKIVSEDVKTASKDLLDVLAKDTTDNLEKEKVVENALNIANSNKNDLSDAEKKELEELQASYEKNGCLTDSENAKLLDILDSILEDHVTKSEYDAYVKDKLDNIINDYNKLEDDAKKEILNDLLEDLRNSDSLDYQDKDAIKKIENILENGGIPNKEQIESLKNTLDNVVSSSDKDYDEVVSNDAEDAIDDLLGILTKDITNTLEKEKAIENALNIAEANKTNLSTSEKKVLEELKASYEKNGTLTNSEVAKLLDILESVLRNHETTSDYTDHMDDMLDKIVDNYDKLPSDIRNDLVESIIDNMLNYDTKLTDAQKQNLSSMKETLNNGKTISKDQLSNLKNIADTATNATNNSVVQDTTTASKDASNAQTGDNTSIFGFVGLAIAGLLGMVGITFKKRKKDE